MSKTKRERKEKNTSRCIEKSLCSAYIVVLLIFGTLGINVTARAQKIAAGNTIVLSCWDLPEDTNSWKSSLCET